MAQLLTRVHGTARQIPEERLPSFIVIANKQYLGLIARHDCTTNRYITTISTLFYDHPFLKGQFLELSISESAFRKEIGSARTFCLEEEAEELQRKGLGCGANYKNTLVVGKEGVIKNVLRYDDEFVRHKILDLLGDLYLLGEPIKGHIIAIKSGHSLNLKLLRKIDQQRKRYFISGIGTQYHPKDTEELDVQEVMKILPHREPFLFVDRIVSLEKGKPPAQGAK